MSRTPRNLPGPSLSRDVVGRRQRASGGHSKESWAALSGNDVVGIDGDIERLLGVFGAKLGCTREKANVALVQLLSRLAPTCQGTFVHTDA